LKYQVPAHAVLNTSTTSTTRAQLSGTDYLVSFTPVEPVVSITILNTWDHILPGTCNTKINTSCILIHGRY
jgi:hypothetical protein